MTADTRWTIGLLILGIVLRLAVFWTLDYQGLDPHFEYIEDVRNSRTLPHSHELAQSHHPPLYYVIGAVVQVAGGEAAVHGLSFTLSVASLFLLVWLIRAHVADAVDRRVCILFASSYPLLLTSSNTISNDPLAILAGTLILAGVHAVVQKPGATRFVALGCALGLGLATKLTLIGAAPACLFIVGWLEYSRNRAAKQTVIWVAAVALIALSIGSYKLIDNTCQYGKPIVSNLEFDPEWGRTQRPTFLSLPQYFDLNVFKLIEHSVYSEEIRHSMLLILYDTTWYQEASNLDQAIDEAKNSPLLRSFFYITPLPFVLTCMLGVWTVLTTIPTALDADRLTSPRTRSQLVVTVATLIWLTMLALVVGVGAHFDVWSCFQTRLLLPAFLAMPLLLATGMASLRQFSPRAARAIAVVVSLQCIGYALVFLLDAALHARLL